MADSFFGFDTTLSRDEECPGDLEDLDQDEQEYDALNDETFGDDNEIDSGPLDDWETQHEQLAEIAESSKKSHNLVPNDNLSNVSNNTSGSNIWGISKLESNTNVSDSRLNNSVPSNLISHENNLELLLNQQKNGSLMNGLTLPKNVCTVEELERTLLNNRNQGVNETPKQQSQQQQQPQPPFISNYITSNQVQQPPPRLPPGLGSVLLTPPYIPPPGLGAQSTPNVFRFLSPHPLLLQHGVSPSHNIQTNVPRPNLNVRQNIGLKNTLLPNRANFPIQNQNYKNFRSDFHHQQNFQPYNHIRTQFHQDNNTYLQQNLHNRTLNINNRNNNYTQHQQHQHQHQHQHVNLPQAEIKDEYAGLMSSREKQWLINIQLLQLNTGTPYFDDFYFTVFVDRQNKLEKENRPTNNQDQHHGKNNRYHSNQHHHNNNRHQNRKEDFMKDDRNRDRDNNPTQIHRTYTPLQFENSLGKLQCGSVTAPRKIIDMDVVSHEKDSDLNQSTLLNIQRDVRKTKQTLLELEVLFGLVLRLEDLNNPLAIANTLKLREIKEKQKIQQLESATTEEKEEILKQLQDDSLVKNDNKDDLLNKLFQGILNDDKFSSYVGIRKGKMLLLRLLPHLCKNYADKHLDIWIKLLGSIPIVGKKDQLGDNILPQFFHFFDRFVEQLNMDSLLKITTILTDMKKAENTRLTPPGKNLLSLVLYNKFGISCITKLFERSESLFATSQVKDHHQHAWDNFLTYIAETISTIDLKMVDVPMQPLENCIMETHLKRTRNITPDKYSLFLNVFCIKHTA